MLELEGRLTALDPEASEGLKVISYFDALIEGHASFEVLLRGAATLCGCASGVVFAERVIRVDEKGVRTHSPTAPDPGGWPEHPVVGDGRAWIERTGPAHANDEIILERLSLALSIAIERSTPASGSRAVDTIIDSTESLESRRAASTRLQLGPDEACLVVAEPARSAGAHGHYTVVATPAGTVRATILRATERFEPSGPAGIGYSSTPDTLDQSWASALASLRLTSSREPVLKAEGLGGITLLAEIPDSVIKLNPDLLAVSQILSDSPKSVEVLEAIAFSDSQRAAAAQLGLHHSTVQSKAIDLSERLGFDLPGAPGRQRLAIALYLHRLSTNRFM
ncbi:MAG: hypothetical protein KF742_04635 [Cryobacterium sp.]|nr:hypothetical protein [Cryobacterium sp.]MBX3090109.1 hypothetical protein [Cryobacterium sp.]MBX3116805.1 hypothetical protein [Cryobacterium sp.]